MSSLVIYDHIVVFVVIKLSNHWYNYHILTFVSYQEFSIVSIYCFIINYIVL